MKANKGLLIFMILAFSVSICIAQPQPGFGVGAGSAKYVSGSVAALKGQTSLNIKFSYDNMMVGELAEDAYITQKTREQNKMKSGSGDSWATKWVSDRATRYEPQFLDWFNKSIKKLGLQATSVTGEATTKYTLTVRTIKMEPGVYVGVSTFGHDMGQDTYINIIADLVETANPSNLVASIAVMKCIGQATSFANYDAGLRLTNAYLNAGKILGIFIAKNCK
ncbi:MAG: hypothetical protein WCQ95_05110 [Bacteroidota bacterium]